MHRFLITTTHKYRSYCLEISNFSTNPKKCCFTYNLLILWFHVILDCWILITNYLSRVLLEFQISWRSFTSTLYLFVSFYSCETSHWWLLTCCVHSSQVVSFLYSILYFKYCVLDLHNYGSLDVFSRVLLVYCHKRKSYTFTGY